MLARQQLELNIRTALGRSRAVVLSGPRQVGKSTLAQRFLSRQSPNYFDLEYPPHAAQLEQATQVLEALQGLVVIDEVQLRPGLFPLLRSLIDRSNAPGQYLLLGSAAPALLRQAGESLLGRVETVDVGGFDVQELTQHAGTYSDEAITRLWLRGGFPLAYLANTDADSAAWRSNAISNHLNVDLPEFGINVPAPTMLRFWTMLAHWHGQTWTAAPFAQSMGVSEPAIRRYLDTLTQTFMIRQLQPWHENLGKRQVKAPKIYFRDTGLLHTLMGIKTLPELGRLCARADFAHCPARRSLLLGHPPRGRARPADAARPAAHRCGIQTRRCPHHHQKHAHCHARPEAGRAVCGVPRPAPLPHGRRRGGGAAVGGVASSEMIA
jgi:uncharacterized protein